MLVPRDMATISSLISSIRTDVVSLDSVVKAYTGGSITSIQASLDELVDSVTTGATMVAEQPSLFNLDALGLVTPLHTLGSIMATTMNDLVAQNSLIARRGDRSGRYDHPRIASSVVGVAESIGLFDRRDTCNPDE